ncbi:MAG TPA: hypothetical protein DDY49_08875 [Paenibacillaceae bacterium]|nr:hypothetical protein [Paenibacillaceae bacterium]
MLTREWLRGVGKAMVHMVYPEKESCQLCGKPIRFPTEKLGTLLCESCQSDIHWIGEHVCKVCGREENDKSLCGDCGYRSERHFVFSRSATHYNEGMKQLLYRYKYQGDRKVGKLLGAVLYQGWKKYYDLPKSISKHPIHLLTFVPMHEERLFERSFNQSKELAEELSEKTGIPMADLLIRVKATDKQSKQGREERLRALRGAFRYKPGLEVATSVTTESIGILLVDDIYTTGATLNEAARVIRRGLPNAKVYGLTVSR